jgi:L-fucose isomerase-like protein
MAWAQSLAAEATLAELAPKTKVRVGKIYMGHPRPGWPTNTVDLDAEMQRFEKEMAKLPGLADVEFVDGGLVGNAQQLAVAKEKFKDVSGILVLHLTMGIGGLVQSLMELNIPVMIFALPYSGHEWHIVGAWQRQGRLVDVLPSSRFADIAEAVRPFRAIHRLKETRILHVSHGDADAKYCQAIRDKFGTEIISIRLPDLQKAYEQADRSEATADAKRWIREAKKIVEPNQEDVLKGSLMYIAIRDLLLQHRAQAITMNCLGMGLIDRNMGYPCLGFVRLNNQLLAGVCEADLKSTMTQLIFTYLVGRTGFVTDPVFDLSNSTIIHAHCVAATQMEGPNTKPSMYHIRTHLEDNRGVSLMVRMPIGRKVSMARLIGMDNMLFSTGDAVDSPFVERGCRSKLTMRVDNIEKFLSNWSCGLHRVIFYGDHTRDLGRYCRFMKIRLLREGIDDLQNMQGLEWETYVHA